MRGQSGQSFGHLEEQKNEGRYVKQIILFEDDKII